MQMQLSLTVNDHIHPVQVDPDRPLLGVLRDEIGLTGTKYGCGDGKCGACTVLVDGNPVQSCSISAGAAAGSRITTVEGLAQDALHPVQAAFLQAGALQCGYCTPGMIISAVALLQSHPNPSDAEILHVMQDNICRCGSYARILDAIRTAAGWLREGNAPLIPAHSLATPIQLEIADDFDEGLVVVYPDPDLALALYGEATPPPADQRPLTHIGPWVHIAGDGSIRAYVGKAEVGQNMRTSIALMVAEELRIAVDRVQVIASDTARVPYDIGTFGSRTTPITGPQMWRTGAATRELLLELAGAVWNVDPATLDLADGAVIDPISGRQAAFSELARDRQIRRVVDPEQPVTPPAQWTVAGQSTAKLNGQNFVTGAHRFASDLNLPGMLFGKILRPPAFQSTLADLDPSQAEALPGVTVVHEGDFVAAVAPDDFLAAQAVDALRARWQTPLQISQTELFDFFKASPVEGDGRRGPVLVDEGSVQEAMAQAHQTLEERYTVDFIAHVPLEPRAALAHWTESGLTVWTGGQRPFGVRDELMTLFDLPADRVRVIVPETGSGYGGKHAGDAAIEAARLAKATGQPVKVNWTRQEEFTWAQFRPGGLIEIASGVDETGCLTAMQMVNYNSGSAGIDTLYEIPNRHMFYQPTETPLRQGAYRALSTTANHFARESHMDGWAQRLGEDPLAFRLRHLTDPRLRAVFEAAAEAFGWGVGAPSEHHGFGLAGGYDKGSYVAACVEVYVNPNNGQPRVVRVVEAFDCGAVINPDNVRSQVEGAILQGLGGALFESVRFANGRILNPGFAGYRVPRFADMPQIETVLIDRKDAPSAGAGETPIIAIAPATGNAIFQATGVRLRAMPMTPHGVPKIRDA